MSHPSDLVDLVVCYLIARDAATAATLATAVSTVDCDDDGAWSRRCRAAVSDELDAEESLRRAVGLGPEGELSKVLLVAHAARVRTRKKP